MDIKKISEGAVKWLATIAAPLLVAAALSLFTLFGRVEAQAASLKILEVRINALEIAVRDMRNLAEDTQQVVQNLRIDQAVFSTKLDERLTNFEKIISAK